ncbi:hypothetical protein SPHINGOT1_20155 [Sphingomonas sp. T1]|nr:hypothetical protein SPHINGOT1_20155 [Sphingomonas sp. T1]
MCHNENLQRAVGLCNASRDGVKSRHNEILATLTDDSHMNTYRRSMANAGNNPLDRRCSNRTAMSHPAVLITSLGDKHSAIIQNVSTLGFKVRSEYEVTVGRFLSIDIPGLATYSGWVAWSYRDQFGLDVANAIPEPVIKHIIAMAVQAGEGPAPGFS